MELTREEIELFSKCDKVSSCRNCGAWNNCPDRGNHVHAFLGRLLLKEMDKPKVWANAPNEADKANVNFFRGDKILAHVYSRSYKRELPKSRIDEIAEEAARFITQDNYSIKQLSKTIKSAILRDREERGKK